MTAVKPHNRPIVVPPAQKNVVGNVHYYDWQIATAKEVYTYFNGKVAPNGHKLLPIHAAAFVEMADSESSFRPDVWSDHESAYGLWQMHTPRLNAACNALKLPVPVFGNKIQLTLPQQLDLAWADITSKKEASYKALSKLLLTTSAYEAGATLCQRWERPKSWGQVQKRGNGTVLWYAFLTVK